MFFQAEDKLEVQEKKLKELELENEQLKRKTESYFESLGLNAAEVDQYMNNPDNFTPEFWEELTACRKKLAEKLERDLKSVVNVKKAKANYSNLNLPSYAIFVR